MAKTTFTTSNALTKKAFDEKLFRDATKESYFSKFMGEGSESCVQVKTELEKGKGDKVTFGLRTRLTGAGVTSGTVLEGNEERLNTYDCSVTLEQYRHAVRTDGKMSEQRAVFSIDEESKKAIKDWGAEKIDQIAFDTLGIGSGATTSPTKVFYPEASAGAFTSAVSFTAAAAAMSSLTNQKLTLEFIPFLQAWAQTGGNRDYIPIRPFKVDGKNYRVLLTHPDVTANLKTSSSYLSAMREAEVRGKENPLFTGAEAIYDGLIIHTHENCYRSSTSSTHWARSALLGAQSMVWAWGQRPKTVQDYFDYENETGYAWGMIAGAARSEFNSKTYGSAGLLFACTNIAGA